MSDLRWRLTLGPGNSMDPVDCPLVSGKMLRIREAVPEDAGLLLEYIEMVSGESDYLSFGCGEFELNETLQADELRRFLTTDNQLYILGMVDGVLSSALFFAAGSRPRLRHVGEFGMTVRRDCWRMGIGQLMLQTLTSWAKATGIVRKIDLSVRADNFGAIRMYELNGFVHQGTTTRGMLVGGTYHDVRVMGLEIAGDL